MSFLTHSSSLNGRRQRRAGDPRITPEGREILLRLVDGDLVDEFQAELDGVSRPTRSSGGGAVLE